MKNKICHTKFSPTFSETYIFSKFIKGVIMV